VLNTKVWKCRSDTRRSNFDPNANSFRSPGKIIASSNKTLRVCETAHPPVYYFPVEDVNMQYLKPISRSSYCEWKGNCSYWDVQIDGNSSQWNCSFSNSSLF
jgi:uncharacterized protein (DUF427 family)